MVDTYTVPSYYRGMHMTMHTCLCGTQMTEGTYCHDIDTGTSNLNGRHYRAHHRGYDRDLHDHDRAAVAPLLSFSIIFLLF